MVSIPDKSFKRFENYTIKLSAKETKWTSLEVRAHRTFLETLISKYDFGPVKLPVLSRNVPLHPYPRIASKMVIHCRYKEYIVFKSFSAKRCLGLKNTIVKKKIILMFHWEVTSKDTNSDLHD